MRGKTYLILGGGGAFGLTLANYLLDVEPRARVAGVGRNPLRPEPFALGLTQRPNFEYRQFHVGFELDLLMEYIRGLDPDVIVNFAAQGEGAASWKSSWRFFDTNATALCRMYEALTDEFDESLFIHISTSELYGSVAAPVAEDAPIKPSSPYSASKAAFDLYLLAMIRADRRRLPTVILRPSNCYCPGQLLHRIIPRAVVAGLTGDRVPLHGGGRARKSYMHARDLARAVKLIADVESPLRPVYNLGPRDPIQIRDLALECAKAVGRDFQDLFTDAAERTGQDACYWLDSSIAMDDLGWAPEISLTDGLREMVDWSRANLAVLRGWPTGYQLHA